jgi:endonuclease YncB( thermonuclease family)
MRRKRPRLDVIQGGRRRLQSLPPPPPRPTRPRRPKLAAWILAALAAALLILHVKPIRSARELAGLAEPTCRVLSFTDGDTLQAWCPGDGLRTIRLTGFDTPEIGFGAECPSERLRGVAATLLLAAHVFAAEAVTVVPLGEDRHGRRLGAMFLDGEPLADGMTATSLARRHDGGRRMSWCSETPRPHR